MSGVTLQELLVTMAILGILTIMAFPAMASILARWQRDKATQAIVNHLQLARTTAIKTSKRVVMCNSLDGIQCASQTAYEWATGWIIFQDNNSNNSIDTNETLIARGGAVAGILSISSSNKIRQFVFLPSGLMAAGMSSLVVTPTTGDAMNIIVNRIGRLRLSSSPNETT